MSAAICDIAVAHNVLLFAWSRLHGNLWSGGVSLRDAATKTDRELKRASNDGVAAVAFFGVDLSHIVAAGDSGSLSLWRRTDADREATVLSRAHDDIITSIATRDQLPILTASFDRTVRLWRDASLEAAAASISSVSTFTGHTDAVLGVVYVSENTFVSCSRDGTAALWDVRGNAAESRPVHCFRPPHRSAVTAIDANAHGFVAATADGSVLAFDLRRSGEPPTLLHKCANAVNRVRTLADQSSVAFVDDDGQLHVVDGATNQHRICLQHRSPLRALALDSQSNLFVGALDGSIETISLK
jgi:WD40 repeat protein